MHDLNTISGRMLYAADVLEEVGVIYKAFRPEECPWNAATLRLEAPHAEADAE